MIYMSRTVGIFLLVCSALAVLWFLVAISFPQGRPRPPLADLGGQGHGNGVVAFSVQPGESLGTIAQHLATQGLVKNILAFHVWARVTGASQLLQAGEYQIPQNVSIARLVRALQYGLFLAPARSFTVREGWNLRDIGFAFERAGIAQAEEFWLLAGFPAIADYRTTDLPSPFAFAAEFDFLQDRPAGAGLEGYLFPDTYFFEKDMALQGMIRMILTNFGKKVSPAFLQLIQERYHSLHEIVVVASLLEREVATREDRRKVADIVWRRLRVNMPLQMDATVNYITGGKSPSVSLQDTTLDSPYNTYRYTGLPPAPISNPSLMSLEAALNPQSNPFWYYLSAPEGTTIFSRTFAEHIRAKAKYLGR